MKTHNYLFRVNDDLYQDLQRVKELDGASVNSLLNEGARYIRDKKMQEISQQRKTRNSLQGIVGW